MKSPTPSWELSLLVLEDFIVESGWLTIVEEVNDMSFVDPLMYCYSYISTLSR